MMVFKRLLLWLRSPGNTLWVQPTLGALLAVFAALFAAFENFEPGTLPEIGQDTLADLLGVLASSMLAVSTFSLSIMVSAFASASNGATPRATELVMGDDRTRRAIASFISAFIYAIVAKIALGLEYYGQNGRFILFVSTVFVLVYLVVTLIMWVNTLSRLGGLNNIPSAKFFRQPRLHCAGMGKIPIWGLRLRRRISARPAHSTPVIRAI